MKTHHRGSAINFESVFTSSAGTILQVTAATLTIQHPLDGFPLWNGTHTTTYSLTNTSTVTGTWEYNWDSSPSAGGVVSWHIIPASTIGVTKSGQLYIKSGPAATWVHGPSTITANDE
jgi:hypothetical protein